MVTSLNLLGSTGSIGVQTLSICRRLGISVTALSANHNIGLLSEQARTFMPKIAVTADHHRYGELKLALADTPIKVLAGADGLLEAAACEAGAMTLNAIVGIAGLCPTIAALESGRQLALANKESLVTGGALVMALAAKHKRPILPVDSEHSAIFQCLNGAGGNKLKRIILTASGGPFFGRVRSDLLGITKAQALRHPTYQMGAKISIDSATLMNKGLELIEAMWLFGVTQDTIDIVVHPQSVIHSAVEFEDGAVIAQMGLPDMALPIQYALTYPARLPGGETPPLDLAAMGSLTFARPDGDTFLCLKAAQLAAARGGTAPTVLNGANEAAVAAFLDGRIDFLAIGELVTEAIETIHVPLDGMASIFEADAAAREMVSRRLP